MSVTHEDGVRSLVSLSGLRIRCCCELCGIGYRCNLGSGIAVAATPIQPPAWEFPYAAGEKKKKPESLKDIRGIPLRGSRLSIWHFHCSSLDSIPGLVNFHLHGQKKKKKLQEMAALGISGTSSKGGKTFLVGCLRRKALLFY